MREFIYLITPFGFALVITILLVPVWIMVCRKWHLFDEPDARKHHIHQVPSMGGIAIFAGLFCSFLVFATVVEHEKIIALFAASLILFFTGFFDDLINVSAIKKLILQAVSTSVAFFGGFRISNLDGILGIYEIPEFMQWPLTLFLVMTYINAFNFIDGVDGLAGCIGVIASSCMGSLFFHYGLPDFAILSFCLTGALLGFLFFNFSPAKIFMGDTGTLVIGFILSILGIELLSAGVSKPEIAIDPSYLFAILFIPIYDLVRVSLIRIFSGTSPFLADRNHLHHKILGFGFGHRSTSLLIASVSLLIIATHQFFPQVSNNAFLIVAPAVSMVVFNNRVLALLASVHHKIFGNLLVNKSHSGSI